MPAAEDVELKLQAAYDRYAARKQEAAASLRGKLDGLRGLGREDVADRLRHMGRGTASEANRSHAAGQAHAKANAVGFPHHETGRGRPRAEPN